MRKRQPTVLRARGQQRTVPGSAIAFTRRVQASAASRRAAQQEVPEEGVHNATGGSSAEEVASYEGMACSAPIMITQASSRNASCRPQPPPAARGGHVKMLQQ